MTDQLASALAAADGDGQCFDNVVRRPPVTCRICGEPTAGAASLCRHCRDHGATAGTADLVVPLVYAVAGEHSGKLMRDYKDHPLRTVRERSAATLRPVVAAALSRHSACIDAVVGLEVAVRTTVPSLTFRTGRHPFARLILDAGVPLAEVLRAAPAATCHRVVTPEKFDVVDPVAVAGRHVLVLDDVWTTGSNAQSAALTLRRAGASAVSVMVLARHLNPRYTPTARFLRNRDRTAFDPFACPVGGSCRGA